jgi:hypothetical protein
MFHRRAEDPAFAQGFGGHCRTPHLSVGPVSEEKSTSTESLRLRTTLAGFRCLGAICAVAVGSSLWGQRTVSFQLAGNRIASAGTASVLLASQGDENAAGFSVTFNPAVLRYDGYTAGADAGSATILANETGKLAGRVGYGVMLR